MHSKMAIQTSLTGKVTQYQGTAVGGMATAQFRASPAAKRVSGHVTWQIHRHYRSPARLQPCPLASPSTFHCSNAAQCIWHCVSQPLDL